MQYIFSKEQSKNLDNYLINELGYKSSSLMETAALQASQVIKQIAIKKNIQSFIILCGSGNNGGDGFAISRILSAKFKVKVLWIGDLNKMSEETKANYLLIIKLDIKNLQIESETSLNSISFKSDCIIDCLIGIGGDENIKGLVINVLKKANKKKSFKIAIDVPTGLNANTGKRNNDYFKCDALITMYSNKIAYLFDKELLTKTHICDLSIQPNLIKEFSNVKFIENSDVRKFLPQRKSNTSKFDYGIVSVIAGGIGMEGAGALTANATINSGAGLVHLFTYSKHSAILPEIICHEIDTAIIDNVTLNKSKAIAIGPGIGKSKFILDNVIQLVDKYKDNKYLVIDADALYALPKLLNQNVILTPHLYEFSRISGYTIEEIENDRINLAIKYAQKMNCVLLLKGGTTIITNGIDTFLNITGNSGMSTAGSGDVLTGVILSFLSQGLTSINATILAVFIHGRAADIYTNKYNKESLTASNIINYLKYAI